MKIVIQKCYCNTCVKKHFLGILYKLKKSALCVDRVSPSVCNVVLANNVSCIFTKFSTSVCDRKLLKDVKINFYLYLL